jgi:hypothetical protein
LIGSRKRSILSRGAGELDPLSVQMSTRKWIFIAAIFVRWMGLNLSRGAEVILEFSLDRLKFYK